MSAAAVNPDDYDRVTKLLVDSGQASTFAEAERLLATYRIQLLVGEQACLDPAWQAAALTVVNAGARAVHGGVAVSLGDQDSVCTVPLAQGERLEDALRSYGARAVDTLDPEVPTILLGEAAPPADFAMVCHAQASEWTASVTPSPSRAATNLAATHASVPAAVMAGALAVSECFQHLRRSPVAGDRTVGVSLWRPDSHWESSQAEGPAIAELPSGVWLLGLGHLGQAYAWLLGLLPYPRFGQRPLVLQDDDRLSKANRATSMLHSGNRLGIRKARLAAAALEGLGWEPRLIEHRYLGGPLFQPGDPTVLLSGVDNPDARARLDETMIPVIIDAGLGRGPDGFLDMTVRRLPSERPSAEIWASRGARGTGPSLLANDAYRDLERQTGDRCGVEELAGRTVATAFVGVTAACWALGGLLRELHGGERYELIDYSLRNPDVVRVVRSSRKRPPRVATVPILEDR